MTGTRYLALFKGINVGRAKRIAMADLRRVLGGLGYTDVATHQQSGNAVFGAEGDAAAVGTAIREAVRTELGVDAAVVVRTRAQLTDAIAADPFGDIADDPAKHLLGFFAARPPADRLAEFRTYLDGRQSEPPDDGGCQVTAEHCYLWCPAGVLKSPFGTVDWDRRLGVVVTMRNFSTVLRMVDLLGGPVR